MSKEETTQSGGIGFFGLLGIVFIVLKLTGFIDWSWWWVTAPIWGGFALVIGFLLLIFGYVFVREFFSRR
jgi:hypothetical protein